jgi:phosphoribosylanthranilate isomerase
VTRVKICGITAESDAELCLDAGADALGFVVEYPLPVPWTLERGRAARLMRGLPPFAIRVAVVGGDADAILRVAEATEPDAVQLHLDEDEATVERVRRGLDGARIRVIKAIRVSADEEGKADLEGWASKCRRFVEAGADAILLDSKTRGRPAGTGVMFDWTIARAAAEAIDAPLVLAGGLTADNVGRAIAQVRPYAVDVISAVEDERHRKVEASVRAFVDAAKREGPPPSPTTAAAPSGADTAEGQSLKRL